jgi:hypothetical protein
MGRVARLAGGRITRRRFALAGLAGLGGVAAAVYAPLAVGGGFERLVASRLGIGEELATAFLERVRNRYGDAEYDARAALFALCFKGPTSVVVPDSVKRSAAEALIQPMLGDPAANIAYAVPGRDPLRPACMGLVRRT